MEHKMSKLILTNRTVNMSGMKPCLSLDGQTICTGPEKHLTEIMKRYNLAKPLADKCAAAEKENEELKTLIKKIRSDLLMRSEEDETGCSVVDISSFIWDDINKISDGL